MAFKENPSVYLVTKPAINWSQIANFFEEENVPPIPDSVRAGDDESAAVIEISARMCYMSFGRGRRDITDFINNLLSSKDGSVFEHVNYGFIVTGVSRSLTHELVRHRAGFAYSQRSQRYVDETEGTFVVPPALSSERDFSKEARKVLDDALIHAAESYTELVTALEKSLPKSIFDSNT
ncbi:MAG: FAD-dependent thymidylate synthase, partial [Chloroflexota bacterium]|nr:FAD-dependent thymidylate synthase [Chloroflexota bacterium]